VRYRWLPLIGQRIEKDEREPQHNICVPYLIAENPAPVVYRLLWLNKVRVYVPAPSTRSMPNPVTKIY
jgi:hypothetical protein